MNRLRPIGLILLVFALPVMIFAQATITGKVTDAGTGRTLPGANVLIEGTTMGAAADASGNYLIANVPSGNITISASVIGYEKASQTINLTGATTINFALETSAIQLSALEVFASRATRETPVAYSDVAKAEMELRLGSQDIPMILNLTPSVYATMQGGGAGDARVNVRGFNQRNVAVMINGVPVNDMENGWVYWSNWDGVADATSSIQMQRGLSAVNLATPSIGGTMNIITDPMAHEAEGRFKQELGSGGFLKSTLSYHSGMIGDKLAIGATIVRKTGDGVIDKAWTDAWAYYFGASYAMNSKNRFELYALGAPQRHGQMRYKQNIAAFDTSYAKEFDDYDLDEDGNIGSYAEADPDDIYGDWVDGEWVPYDGDAESGRFFNENWNVIDSDYKGKQYWYMYGAREVDRYDPDFLNESENYFHKPQVNLNWYLTMSEAMRLSSTFYFSGGSGGGTGTFGDIYWYTDNYSDPQPPSRIANWNGTIAINQDTTNRKGNYKPAGESIAFLRNSINRQWTVGAISKLNYDLSDALKLQFGLDWRTAEILHNREVRDLLGGDYAVNGIYDNYASKYQNYKKPNNPELGFYNEFDWVFDANGDFDYDATFANAADKQLGDNINYNNTNTVDWLGFFGQGEFDAGLFSVYGMVGFSMIKYTLLDHFKMAENHMYETDTAGVATTAIKDGFSKTGDGELMIEADAVSAIQFKGGGLFRLTDQMEVFANFGLVEKPPILDNIIDDIEISLAPDPQNEEFLSMEFGLNFRGMGGRLNTKFNLYSTTWKNRTVTKLVNTGAGSSTDTDVIFLTGMDQKHQGLEAEVAFQPMDMIRLDAALSFGMWEHTNDVTGDYKNIAAQTTETFQYSIEGLEIGDMPQTIVALGASVFPINGMTIQAVFNYYDRHWADWSPLDRDFTDEADADRESSWSIPSASKIDLHATYDLPISLGNVKLQAFVHVFNLLDAVYIQDATDNSAYNAYDNDDITHESSDAEVYLATPRFMNFGLSVAF